MAALVCALNPSIDAEWRVEQVQWEEKNSVESERRWAGGKGVNVARWLRQLGGQPRLLLPLGGRTGAELAGFLRGEGLPAQIVRLREATRVNVIVSTAAGRQLRFNPPGPKLARVEWEEVLEKVEQGLRMLMRSACEQCETPAGLGLLRQPSGAVRVSRTTAKRQGAGAVQDAGATACLLILSGSLPRGVPVTAYAQLIRLARRLGVRTLLDCDGAAFAAGVRARPFLVKPNEHELAQWRRKPLLSEEGYWRAALELSKATGGWVLLSRGARASWLVNARTGERYQATPPRVRAVNTVGAGDAMLAAAALQIERGAPPEEWLRRGVTVGTAMTQSPPGRIRFSALRRGSSTVCTTILTDL